MKPLLLLLVLFPLPLYGEDLDPRLQPLAETYDRQVEAIQTKAEESHKKPVEEYLAQLKAAEDKATKSGAVAALTALTKEIDNVGKGIFLPVPHADLPKLVQTQHKRFHKALDDVDAAMAKERKALDSKYLTAIAKIMPAAETDTALERQIAEQKRRVTSGISGPITNLQEQLGGTRWQRVADPNHFEHFTPEGRFSHWRYTTPDPETVILHWNANSSMSWKLAKDGKTLLRNGVPDLKLVQQQPK